MSTILDVRHLIKTYGNFTAVNDISFTITAGTCFGLLGPNGAGKTTALEIIEDITEADSGEILYKGKKRSGSFREEVGIQFQETELLSNLSVRETLETFGGLFAETRVIQELIQICHLEDILTNMNNKLSGGQKQRLLLAIALVNNPDLIFLDEPTTGMDPQARRNLWDIMTEIKDSGRTVILTTHYMEEAESLCDQIAIMDHGKIIAQGSPEELTRNCCGGTRLELKYQSMNRALLEMGFYKKETGIELITGDINSSIRKLVELSINLKEMEVHTPNLEDVFLNLTGRTLRD